MLDLRLAFRDRFLAVTFCAVLPALAAGAASGVTFRDGLHSGPISGRGARSAVAPDVLAYRLAVGDLAAPVEGEPSGEDFRGLAQNWRSVEIDDPSRLDLGELRGGLVHVTCESEEAQVVVLQPDGFRSLVVNGVPRMGDYYSKGRMLVPVMLRAGSNSIWCALGRGRSKALSVEAPRKPLYLTANDPTLPDFLTDETDEKWAAVRIVNASNQDIGGLRIESESRGGRASWPVDGELPRLFVRKAPFKLRDEADQAGEESVTVRLFRDGDLLDEIQLTVEVKEPDRNYRRTFLSGVDGSVQYYGVREGGAAPGEQPALFVSTHGAGVKGIRQAGSYQSKDWGHVVAPTNRREFGFDWEDWGRLDALEAIRDAERRFQTDPDRTYLTGHSMGGHGAWHLGATFPSRWAAVAPAAGWRSFFSYASRGSGPSPHPMQAVFDRASNPSRTTELMRNYLHHGVFIEHGDADRTVPVSEARFMKQRLAEFHPDFAYHEEPGGGHWYGVDHPRIFNFFGRHRRKDPRDLATYEFRTACPGVSADGHLVTLFQQQRPFEFSGVVLKQDIRTRRQRRTDEDLQERKIEITTENLTCLRVDLRHCLGMESVSLEVDGQPIDELPWPDADGVWLRQEGDAWNVVSEPVDPRQKTPARYGGFKDAFRHHFVFVVSTHGTDEENAWSFDKARYDAEAFYYRGNGAAEIVTDAAFDPAAYADRSVIVYGCADANSAWSTLLADSPVVARRGELKIGERSVATGDLALYMVRPRPDSEFASVGVVAGTGPSGHRAAFPCRYFIAGTGYPDVMAFSPTMHTDGPAGVVAAGYFDNDWSLDSNDILWAGDGESN